MLPLRRGLQSPRLLRLVFERAVVDMKRAVTARGLGTVF
jgi:hypothetical protein